MSDENPNNSKQHGNDSLSFFPRPDAHAMNWHSLLPPVQKALRDLFVRINAAAKRLKIDRYKNERTCKSSVSNCFLIYGARGTGKTTVLLSAELALSENNGAFFSNHKKNEQTATKKKDEKEEEKQESWLDDSKRCVKTLKNIIWLETLDLEPLLHKANLLTVVLTRILGALDANSKNNKRDPLVSLYEEDADSARKSLQRLINDATYMWEDIIEPDTRGRANKQLAAADYFNHFRANFDRAMKALVKELDFRNYQEDGSGLIVLPIDNIDRSTDHLHSIVKLAHLVSCRYLLLVMAGNREDVDLFLERAYWKELNRTDEGPLPMAKTGLYNEDESFVMARRQAAASSLSLLPPGHRVEVQLVDAMDVLTFTPSSDGTNEKSIVELLVDDAWSPRPWKTLGEQNIKTNIGRRDISFAEFFYAKEFVALGKTTEQPEIKEFQSMEKKYLTHASQALYLPARIVLDLWMLAHSAAINKYSYPKGTDKGAQKIARGMLRNVIFESKMPSEMGRLLQEEILHRNDRNGETILNFHKPSPELKVSHTYTPVFSLRSSPPLEKGENKGISLESLVRVNRIENVHLRLEPQERRRDSVSERGRRQSDKNEKALPPLVAAWLSVLHDVLIYSKSGAVICPPEFKTPPLLETIYNIAPAPGKMKRTNYDLTLSWPGPCWNTFFAHDVFTMKWKEHGREFYRIKIDWKSEKLATKPQSEAFFTEAFFIRILVSSWVLCAIETFIKFEPFFDDPEIRSKNSKFRKRIKDESNLEEFVGELECNALCKAAELHQKILGEKFDPNNFRECFNDVRTHFMVEWLEYDLPLLLSNMYVPLVVEQKDIRLMNFKKAFEDAKEKSSVALFAAWKSKKAFILANFQEKLKECYKENADSEKPESFNQDSESKTPEEFWLGKAKQDFEDLLRRVAT